MLPSKTRFTVTGEHDAEGGGEYTGLGRFVLAFSQIPKSAGAQGPHVKWYSISIKPAHTFLYTFNQFEVT